MAESGFVSHAHRKKPPGRPMPVNIARATGAKSRVRIAVEHVFAEKKSRMALFIRTVGLDRARAKIGLVYNVKQLAFLKRHTNGLGW